MVTDGLQKLRFSPEHLMSDLIYFDNANTWEDSIKGVLPLFLTHLTFRYLTLHYMMLPFSCVYGFKHTGTISHLN